MKIEDIVMRTADVVRNYLPDKVPSRQYEGFEYEPICKIGSGGMTDGVFLVRMQKILQHNDEKPYYKNLFTMKLMSDKKIKEDP